MAPSINMPGYLLRPLSLVSAVITVFLLVLGGGIWWLSSDSGRVYVEHLVQSELSSAIGYQVRTEALRIGFPLTVRISRFSLVDEKGVWLEGENIAIHLLPTLNIRQDLVIRKINADALRLLRAPESAASGGDEGSEGDAISISVLGINVKEAVASGRLTGFPEDMTGSVAGSIRLNGATGNLAFQAKSLIKQGLPELDTANLTISGAYQLDENIITFETLKFSNPKLEVAGNGHINLASGEIQAAVKSGSFKIGDWTKQAAGSVGAEAAITGTIDAPLVKATVTSQDVIYNATAVPDATTSLSVLKQDNVWLGDIHIDAAGTGDARATFRMLETTLELQDITARYLESELVGELEINMETFLTSGKLQAKIPEIQKFSGFLTEPISGAVNMTAALSAKAGKQATALVFDLQNLEVRGANISAAKVEMDFSRFPTVEPESIKVKLTNAFYADMSVNRALLEASRNGQSWKANLIAEGSADRPFSMKALGEVKMTPTKGVTARIISLNGAYGKIPFSSPATIVLSITEHSRTLTAPALKVGSGILEIEVALTDKSVTATATGKNILIPEFQADLPQELKDAQLAFALDVNGPLSDPQVGLDAVLTGAKLFGNSAKSQITAKAALQNDRADLSVDIDDVSSLRSNINLRIPVNFSIEPFNMSLDESAPVSGGASLALNMSVLSALLLPPEHVVKGAMNAKLSFSGNIAAPGINGQIRVEQGAYNYLPLGVNLQKFSATVAADTQTFTLTDFHAEDANGNSLSATGTAGFKSNGEYAYDLRLGARRFALINHPNARSVISGDIVLKGGNQSGAITGQILSEALYIFLPDRFVASVPELNIVETIPISAKPGKTQSSVAANDSLTLLDVTLVAENKVFVRGWGLDAELKGKLHLTGNILDPAIQGKFSTIRGRYEEFGKRFKLQKAELLFQGDIPPSPYLNVVAATTESGVEIRPVITGPVREPALKIESTPAMPQDEALSILLFGKDSTKISPVQAVQLANSLRRLSGKGGPGFDPAGAVRNLLGLDDFSINGSGENGEGATVGVGKYIGDKIYLEVESGAQTGRASVEIEVTPNITVESVTGATGENSVGVNWKHDY